MSEKKKRVIKVDDLFIEAENVVINQRHRGWEENRHDDRVDPFFGPRRRREQNEERESSSKEHRDESSDRRGGFRWF
ncbi:hypothetical protein [Halobacillus sp. BBL2006]|uniref:hypothetical protein n=1 Tax=Halobacillus sp. BBL2006 TaxID=1543706 RepID=UPI000543116A|nr:hypothetical protein [Halobacillus sp. BBL2006]KHE72056.1 hypothetical protein LD39_06565 [Halobacillus sp. BBL2006]